LKTVVLSDIIAGVNVSRGNVFRLKVTENEELEELLFVDVFDVFFWGVLQFTETSG